jgi:hypothetical protein
MAQPVPYEPTEAEAFVLLAGTEAALAAPGASAGLRLTRARTALVTLDLPTAPDEVRQRAGAAIIEHGVVIDDPNGADDGSVWGLVASGAMNLTTALVRVAVADGAAGGSHVEIRGTGQEGLIKQKIGAKAADRIAQQISAA